MVPPAFPVKPTSEARSFRAVRAGLPRGVGRRPGPKSDRDALNERLRALSAAREPIQIQFGKPTELFSVTNANGKVFSGKVELIGPALTARPQTGAVRDSGAKMPVAAAKNAKSVALTARTEASGGHDLGWLKGTWVYDEERSGPKRETAASRGGIVDSVKSMGEALDEDSSVENIFEEIGGLSGGVFRTTGEAVDQFQNGFSKQFVRGVRMTFTDKDVTVVGQMFGRLTHVYESVEILDVNTIRLKYNGDGGGTFTRHGDHIQLTRPDMADWTFFMKRTPENRPPTSPPSAPSGKRGTKPAAVKPDR
jgi:hypothetical protein